MGKKEFQDLVIDKSVARLNKSMRAGYYFREGSLGISSKEGKMRELTCAVLDVADFCFREPEQVPVELGYYLSGPNGEYVWVKVLVYQEFLNLTEIIV